MKNLLLVGLLSASLFSCSLLQRHSGPDSDGEAKAPATEDADGPLFTPDGQEAAPVAKNDGGGDAEVSRLSTKIAALETKVDVLSSNLERLQAEKSQPVIQAVPQSNLAAPVGEPTAEIEDQTKSTEVSAAPANPPRRLPTAPKETVVTTGTAGPVSSTAAEREFRAGMELFQNGQNLEAASRFALMAKKFPHHMLAAHALYWAGESAARAQQWAIASENWVELEKKYPHSAYMPEALDGLAKAFEAQGDATRAKMYRSLLDRSFPKSPVAMKMGASVPADTAALAGPARKLSRAEPATSTGEEPAPVFEEDKSEPKAGETDSGAESQ